MSNLFLKHFFYIVLVIFSNLSISENLILVPENILDVRSGKLIKAKVYIEDGIIKSISQDEEEFKTAKIIELSGITLMPGLMDAHVHLIGNNELHGYQSMSESSQMATIYGVKNAKSTLLAGFTTVRNVGAGHFADVALRDAIKQGVVLGPTMLVSGPSLSISGGHGDNNLLPFSSDNHSHKHNIVDNPWDARKAVRINRKYGADLIKFTATGGVMSKNTDVNAKQFTYDEMKALVDEAHSHGMKVAAHAHGLKGIKVAIMAGVDSIEHSSYIDKDTIQLAIDKGTYLSMDIYVSDYILGEGSKKGILEESLVKERKVGKLQRENFKAANSMGANMVFGTDAGIYPHGDNAKQFKYMVQWGMTPLEAIQASTINTAQLFGLSDVGELKEGFKADIVGIRGNPLKQIDLLEDVVFVMKEGLIYKD